jgi:hypothetical protein
MKDDREKTSQALDVIRRAHKQPFVHSDRLLMLLYLSERESWRVMGQPILGTPMFASSALGPVHCVAYAMIRDPVPLEANTSALSDIELTILRRVPVRHRTRTNFQIAELISELAEWKSRKNSVWGAPVLHREILEGLGFPLDEIKMLFAEYPALQRELLAEAN